MNKKIIFVFLVVLLAGFSVQNTFAELFHEVTIFTDKEVYQPRDEIVITFANTGNTSVSFHSSSGGMIIKSLDQNVVLFGGGGYQSVWWMEPSESKPLTFGPYKGIPNGVYTIKMIYSVPEGENGTLVSYHPTSQFEISCKKDLELVFKTTDNSPACVRSDSISKLIERGWAKFPDPMRYYEGNPALGEVSDFRYK